MPTSKSLTNRYLLLAALADGPSVVTDPLVSRDSELMLRAVTGLGVSVERAPDGSAWTLTPPRVLRGGASIDCGLAGTVLRFVPPVAALADGRVQFDGDTRARSRPIAPLLDALRTLGVRVEEGAGGGLPFTIHGAGQVPGGGVEVDASASSQFVSALLLAGCRFRDGLTVRHVGGSLPSLPHITMSVQVLRHAGVVVDDSLPSSWSVAPGPVSALRVRVEPDLSSAAPLLAAAAVTGGEVTVRDWPARTSQPGDAIRAILELMGASASLDGTGLTVRGPARGDLRGADLDLRDVGELTPVVAAVAALATSPSTLSGIGHLRGHETDRLAALETEINRLGGDVRATADGLAIRPTTLHGARLRTYHDHRMAMAAAVLGLVVPGVSVEDIGTTAKTFPDFAGVWARLVVP